MMKPLLHNAVVYTNEFLQMMEQMNMSPKNRIYTRVDFIGIGYATDMCIVAFVLTDNKGQSILVPFGEYRETMDEDEYVMWVSDLYKAYVLITLSIVPPAFFRVVTYDEFRSILDSSRG